MLMMTNPLEEQEDGCPNPMDNDSEIMSQSTANQFQTNKGLVINTPVGKRVRNNKVKIGSLDD